MSCCILHIIPSGYDEEAKIEAEFTKMEDSDEEFDDINSETSEDSEIEKMLEKD